MKEQKPEWHRLYCTAAWKRLRTWRINNFPLCEECVRFNVLRPAPSEVVDHRIPHKGDRVLFYDADNLQALCKPLHDSKTAREDGGFGRAPQDPNAPVPTGEPGRQFAAGGPSNAEMERLMADCADLFTSKP